MREYGFKLSRILPYKDRIADSESKIPLYMSPSFCKVTYIKIL